jgi:diaminohydroxyphosphoribosylaminopyrimidine deaminase/5-amino-6-(5-phosphoribosylamino)uracil reductase
LPDFQGQQPLRVVVDSNNHLPAQARMMTDGGQLLQVLAVPVPGDNPDSAQIKRLALPGIDGKVDLQALLEHLASAYQCNEVLLEAGPRLCGAMLDAGLVDELVTYIAPCLLGHLARPMAVLPGLEHLSQRLEFHFLDVAILGKDCRIRSLFSRL